MTSIFDLVREWANAPSNTASAQITNQPKELIELRLSIDWDGTCVEDAWPEMGAWLPGAKEALIALDEAGFELAIFSCRVAACAFPSAATPEGDTPRPAGEVEQEVAGIKAMLAEIGLEHVEVWQRDYKPPALFYIDNRNIAFRGNWGEVLDFIHEAVTSQ